MRYSRVILGFLASACSLAASSPAPTPDADRHFLDRVKPLLEARCVSCHGPDKQKGALRLDSHETSLQGGDLGPALVPGDPANSLLLQAVLHQRPDLEMPPKDKLNDAEIAILDRWIRDGAPWPASPAPSPRPVSPAGNSRIGNAWTDPENPITRLFHGQRLDLWSLKPLREVEPPSVRETSPANLRHPIDAFIQSRLEQAGLSPAPEADRRTLARRLAFDLTGLPPTPEQVDRLIADSRPDAYERWVDDLLASPRYGEHQARLWLDVIRYSDSNGFDWDEFRPQAWRFRDYVVRAFNADKPFHRFIREQLAGDELLDGAPETPEEQDALLATGYLRLGPQDNSAPLFNEQSRARAEWLADLTETTGSAFLGLTLSCCRCHDHKFDPLSQADHFRIRAFFEPIRYADNLPVDLAQEQAAIRTQHADVEAQLKPVQAQRSQLVQSVKDRVRSSKLARLSDEERQFLGPVPDTAPKDFKDRSAALEKRLGVSDAEVIEASTAEEKSLYQELEKRIGALEKSKRPFTRGLLATDSGDPVPPTRIHYQGDHQAERAEVPPGFLSILDPNPAALLPPSATNTTGRRLTLAAWIAAPENPLTARVYVNRVWQSLFGRGLVATPNDFGLAGARPTHPDLLDWLAGEFLRQGGSTKKLQRLIVTSAAYRRTAIAPFPDDTTLQQGPAEKADAGNALLAHQNLRRVSAEQLRDALLSVAGILRQRDHGGPPVWPELPTDILQANPAFLDDNAEKTKGWYPSPPEERPVRSLYLVQKRTVKVPFLETFDLPDNATSCPQRTESIVAPQALSLLNGSEAIEAAQAFARRIAARANGSPASQVRHAFQLAFQRAPSEPERLRSEAFLAQASLPEFCRALFSLNEFAFVD